MNAVAAPAPEPASPADMGLEEVVVTAEKRSSTVQETALDIAVFSADKLAESGVHNFSTLYKIAPNVNVSSGGAGGIGATVIAINGIRAYNLSQATQSPIAVHLDGVYLARLSGLTGLFYDLKRIEVLAGPQGTLYGRNATGGAVNIITNTPGKEFGTDLELEVGNYNETRLNAALNLPVSDNFAVRLAGHTYAHKGYFTNGLNDAHEDGVRLSALLNISSRATLTGSVDYNASNDHGNGLGLVGVRNQPALISNTGVVTVRPGANVVIPSNPYNDTSVLYPQGTLTSTSNSEIYGAKLQFDYDFDSTDLTAILGYRRMESFNIFLQPPAPLVGGAIGTQEFPGRSNTYSAEVRLASKATNPLQWITGAYFFKENNVGPICVRGTYLATTCAFQEGPNNNNISYAAFAQTTYTPAVLGDKLHLVLGARFNSDEITHSDFENAAFFPLIGKANINRPYLNKTAQKGTYKAGINYDLAPDSLLYVSNSTGYRAFNFQYGEDPYVPPESIHAWNVGSKNLFFDRRLQVNLDAFLYDYFGQERSVQTYPPPQAPFLPFSDITAFSTGEIRYKGASVDLMAAVTANDRVSLSVHYVDATYTDFVLPARFKNTIAYTLQGVPTGQVGNYTGTPVSQVAPWSGTAGYDHDWHFAGGTLTAQLAAQFANETPMADAVPGTLQDVVRPSYVTGDVLLRFASSDDRWTISAWCRNVSNKITWNSAGYGTTTGAAQGGLVTALLNPPRTYGLTFSIKTGNP